MPDLTALTLDQLRPHIITAMLPHVPFDGWSDKAAAQAEAELRLTPGTARLAFPGGAFDLVSGWIAILDAAMAEALDTPDFRAMKVRAKITTAIRTRLALAAPHKEALRSASLVLARPENLLKASRLGWHAADSIWHAAGDSSTDFNHYSKRMLAGAVYGATLLYFLNDNSDGHADSWAFLDRRIADVMNIESLKARLRSDGHAPSLARFLGRLRYPQKG